MAGNEWPKMVTEREALDIARARIVNKASPEELRISLVSLINIVYVLNERIESLEHPHKPQDH